MRYSRKNLKYTLEYARYTHIAIMYLIALIIFLFSHLPHKWWVFLTVLVVSAAIEPGLILKRAKHRIYGTFLALIILLPLLYFLQLNYRLVSTLMVLSFIAMSTSSMNPERYDISVFFITLIIFLITAQTATPDTLEGPLQLVLNRGICTLIGIMIILIGDHFLFNSYQYDLKSYLFNQLTVYDCLKKTVNELRETPIDAIGTYAFMKRLYTQFNEIYSLIAISANSLSLDFNTSSSIRQQIEAFQHTIWELRLEIFSLTSALMILKTEKEVQKHLLRYEELMKVAKQQFLKI